jgi:hypothetical protein
MIVAVLPFSSAFGSFPRGQRLTAGRDFKAAGTLKLYNCAMWRFLLVGIGAVCALHLNPMSRVLIPVENGAVPLILAVSRWGIAIWGWLPRPALWAVGTSLILAGLVLFFVMPRVVNNGSGQDAVDMFGMFLGTGLFLLGIFLLTMAQVTPWPKPKERFLSSAQPWWTFVNALTHISPTQQNLSGCFTTNLPNRPFVLRYSH